MLSNEDNKKEKNAAAELGTTIKSNGKTSGLEIVPVV